MYDEKYLEDYPNSHYLNNLNNLNRTNQQVSLNRLPTLGEILANKTKQPVDFFSFYAFMRDVEGRVDYVDFWIDLIQHLNLCKHYVKGLRDSIIRQSAYNDHTSSTVEVGGYPDNRNSRLSRGSAPVSEPSKHKSLSSSILLELIINDNILEDNDSNRLSQFLRGDIALDNLDPKLRDVIHHYHKHHSAGSQPSSASQLASPAIPYENYQGKRLSSQSRLMDDDPLNEQPLSSGTPVATPAGSRPNSAYTQGGTQGNYRAPEFPTPPPRRLSAINPSLLEKLIRDSPGGSTGHASFVTRDNLKESSHNLLLKYFVTDSEKHLALPQPMNDYIIHAIEVEGRDDPDVFKQVKEYVFNRLEADHLPKFLNFTAIRNVNHSNFFRMVAGFFFLFAGFWIGFTLIFLNYSRGIRAVCVVPFFIAFYLLVSSIILIDPFLALAGYTESFSRFNGRGLLKVREKFIHRLLVKRSIWVILYILVCTAVLAVIFSCVPGHRL
ncbi:hypothetical protein DICA3_B05556 [Diutina catenulata]